LGCSAGDPARKSAPKSFGDHAFSLSSYTPSVVSSSFILSSGTHGSSAPSSISNNKPCDVSKADTFSNQLKKLYRDISHLETKLRADSGEPQDESRVVIKGGSSALADDVEKARWKKAIEDHKRCVPFFLAWHLPTIWTRFLVRNDTQSSGNFLGIWCSRFATQ
jgi:hypothetical protein